MCPYGGGTCVRMKVAPFAAGSERTASTPKACCQQTRLDRHQQDTFARLREAPCLLSCGRSRLQSAANLKRVYAESI
jgi:hypothetical protein